MTEPKIPAPQYLPLCNYDSYSQSLRPAYCVIRDGKIIECDVNYHPNCYLDQDYPGATIIDVNPLATQEEIDEAIGDILAGGEIPERLCDWVWIRSYVMEEDDLRDWMVDYDTVTWADCDAAMGEAWEDRIYIDADDLYNACKDKWAGGGDR